MHDDKWLDPNNDVSEKDTKVPDFIVVKVPQFWEYNTRNRKSWKQKEQKEINQNCTIEQVSKDVRASNSLNVFKTTKQTMVYGRVDNTVQKKVCTIASRQRQFLTAKQLTKVIKKNEPIFLALIRPNAIQNE